MYRPYSDLILINGNKIPCPHPDMEIIGTRNVNAGRNADAQVIGQLVGRKQWKINNLHWTGLDAEDVSYLVSLLEPFFVDVTFTGTDNVRRTLTMYPGDDTGHPLFLKGNLYKNFVDFKVNLIDCGW